MKIALSHRKARFFYLTRAKAPAKQVHSNGHHMLYEKNPPYYIGRGTYI